MNRIVVILAVGALTSGCATSEQQIESHAPALNSWVGAPIDEFLDLQGAPTTVIERADYQIYRFVTWKRKHYFSTETDCTPSSGDVPGSEGAPGTYGAPGSPSRGNSCSSKERYTHSTTFTCAYELLVADNVINDWRMNGNSCRMIAVNHRPG